MSDIFEQVKNSVVLWRISILFFIFYSLDAIATAFVSVMIDVSWHDLDDTQKVIRFALILKAWASAMLAFFTNVGKKFESGAQLFSEPNKQTTTETK